MSEESFRNQNSLSSQGVEWDTISPDDDDPIPFLPKAVCVCSTTGGQFTAVDRDGNEAKFYGNPGQIIPIRPVKIKATGLTVGLELTGLKA